MSRLVTLTTSLGIVQLELDGIKAPVTTSNFLNYLERGHFDHTIFHRAIKGFIIQGGGLDVEMNPEPTDSPIKNEASNSLSNEKYMVSMARTQSQHSATTQFFINVADNDFLNASPGNAGYAVFGHVVSGQDVVDEIEQVLTGRKSGHSDVPVDPVIILKAQLAQ